MSKSTLQVLAPVRGDAPHLVAALHSLRAQTFSGWQATLCPLDANARDIAMGAVDGDPRMRVTDTVDMAEAGALAYAAETDVSEVEVLDYAYRKYCECRGGKTIELADLPDYFVSADRISPEEHVEIQAALQKYVDSSISKTINIPADYPFDKCLRK